MELAVDVLLPGCNAFVMVHQDGTGDKGHQPGIRGCEGVGEVVDGEFVFFRGQVGGYFRYQPVLAVEQGAYGLVLPYALVIEAEVGLVGGFVGGVGQVDVVGGKGGVDEFRHGLVSFRVMELRVGLELELRASVLEDEAQQLPLRGFQDLLFAAG